MHGGKMDKKNEKKGMGGWVRVGPTGSPNIHVLNMKIYYSIMCSVCKFEGNHMKSSQTKSLMCSNWPPFPSTHTPWLPSHCRTFFCFNWEWGRERYVYRVVATAKKQLTSRLTQADPPEYRWAVQPAAEPALTKQEGEPSSGILSAAMKLWLLQALSPVAHYLYG